MAEYMQYEWKTKSLSINKIHDSDVISKTEPTDKTKSIHELRGKIKMSADAEFKNNALQDDETLMKFLYARKFNTEESFQLMVNHYWYRKNNPVVFQNLTPSADDIHRALQDGFPGVLQNRDRRGRCVLLFTAANWDCSYTLLSIYRSLLISLEYLLNEKQNQANGFVVIVDWTEISFKQSTNLAPKLLKLIIDGLQDSFPARFKGIHFIGQPWYVEAALMLIKQFLKDAIKDRIFMHGNNLSTLFEHLPRDILPTELGGEQSSYNPKVWLDRIMLESNC